MKESSIRIGKKLGFAISTINPLEDGL